MDAGRITFAHEDIRIAWVDGRCELSNEHGTLLAGFSIDTLRWICHTGGPAVIVADEARRRIENG